MSTHSTYTLPVDTLRSIPASLLRTTQAGGFTVCDLVVVLEEMSKLFNTEVYLTGPSEGSIYLTHIPVTSWISYRKLREGNNYGLKTELRFNHYLGNDSDELKFVSDCLLACKVCRDRPDRYVAIVQGCNDESDLVSHRLCHCDMRPILDYDSSQMDDLLSRPMRLDLRSNYPHYSWPRWAFGAFEGFVARRIQIKKAME